MIYRTREEVIEQVWQALNHAEKKHPGWPTADRLRQAAIVTEEAGELLRAALNLTEHREKSQHGMTAGEYQAYMAKGVAIEEEILNEARQTAAMAIRLLQGYSCVYQVYRAGEAPQTADARTYAGIERVSED